MTSPPPAGAPSEEARELAARLVTLSDVDPTVVMLGPYTWAEADTEAKARAWVEDRRRVLADLLAPALAAARREGIEACIEAVGKLSFASTHPDPYAEAEMACAALLEQPVPAPASPGAPCHAMSPHPHERCQLPPGHDGHHQHESECGESLRIWSGDFRSEPCQRCDGPLSQHNCQRAPQAGGADDDAERESPGFTPEQATALAARGYERRNRRAGATQAGADEAERIAAELVTIDPRDDGAVVLRICGALLAGIHAPPYAETTRKTHVKAIADAFRPLLQRELAEHAREVAGLRTQLTSAAAVIERHATEIAPLLLESVDEISALRARAEAAEKERDEARARIDRDRERLDERKDLLSEARAQLAALRAAAEPLVPWLELFSRVGPALQDDVVRDDEDDRIATVRELLALRAALCDPSGTRGSDV